MLSKTMVVLSAVMVLSIAFPALAATKHNRVIHAHPAIYNTVGDTVSGGCSPIPRPGVRLCSNICSGSGPCAPPDGW
jgi:hypothetical protein